MKWLDWVAIVVVMVFFVCFLMGILGCAQLRDPSGIKAGSTGDIQITSQGAVGILIFGVSIIIIVVGAMTIMTVRVVKWVTRNANATR